MYHQQSQSGKSGPDIPSLNLRKSDHSHSRKFFAGLKSTKPCGLVQCFTPTGCCRRVPSQVKNSAWEEFMRRYHAVLTAAAVRVSRRWGLGTAVEIDDIVQEIYLKVCADRARILTGFRDPRPEAVFGYLKVVATNIAHDFFRRRNTMRGGGDSTTVSTTEFMDLRDFTKDAAMDIERRVTLSEIDNMLCAHTQTENGRRDRMLFRLYYDQGLTTRAIAELPGIELSSKGVEGVLQRLAKSIRLSLNGVQEIDAE